MRADDIRGLSDEDVLGRIAELERERFNLRFKAGTQTLEDPLRRRAVRKDLARLKTIQQERALGLSRATATAAATGATKGKTAKGAKATKGATSAATAKRAKTTKSAPAASRRRGG